MIWDITHIANRAKSIFRPQVRQCNSRHWVSPVSYGVPVLDLGDFKDCFKRKICAKILLELSVQTLLHNLIPVP